MSILTDKRLTALSRQVAESQRCADEWRDTAIEWQQMAEGSLRDGELVQAGFQTAAGHVIDLVEVLECIAQAPNLTQARALAVGGVARYKDLYRRRKRR
jgi:hypothetical protein